MFNCTQLPDVCVNQPIIYTFIIESNEMGAGIILEGPYFHIGPGLVPHCVNGVNQQRNYSIFVQVTSIAGSSESDKLYFGNLSTKLMLILSYCTNHNMLNFMNNRYEFTRQ